MLRAGLFGAGVVGGYVLLSLFAGPAQAGPADDGIDLGGLVADLQLPVTDPPDAQPEPVAELGTEPVLDPVVETVTEPVGEMVEQASPTVDATTDTTVELTETLTGTTADLTDAVTDAVSDPVAGTPVAPLVETAGESVDRLVAGVDQTVGSTVDPLAATVDDVLPGIVPVVDGVADQPPLDKPLLDEPLLDQPLTLPPDPLAGPVPEPAVAVGAAPELGLSELAATAPVVAPSPAAAQLATGPPVPAVVPAPAGWPPGAVAAPAAPDHDPPPVRRPGLPPVSTSHHLAGDSFDPGHPWPWGGPPTAAHEPDAGQLRSLEDIAYTGLVLPISAPPG